MDIIALKLVAALSLIAIGVVCGLIPYRISVSGRGAQRLEYGIGLAGGIFIGAGLIHLLPDANGLLTAEGVLPDYPAAFLIAGVGFLLVLFLEQVFLHGRTEHDVGHDERFPVVLFLILSIHSFIAGMSMGLELTTEAMLVIFLAIAVHKGFAALALGISLVEGHIPLARIVKTIVVFSLMTPLGVLAGTFFSQLLQSDSARLLEGLFDGLATGTFIYIAAFEMIATIFEHKVNRLTKFAFVTAGFMVMALLAIWA